MVSLACPAYFAGSNHDSLFNKQVILRQAQDDKLLTVWATAREGVTLTIQSSPLQGEVAHSAGGVS